MRFPATLSGLVIAILALFAASATAPAARAAGTYAPIASFGSSGSAQGQLAEPRGLAVARASGDVYLADTGNARVERFGSAGNFISAWGWGVSDGAEESQVCTATCEAGIPGSGAGQLSSPVSLAVDDNPSSPSYEDVYVADSANEEVVKFSSTGIYLATISGTSGGSFASLQARIGALATDPNGNLWVENLNADPGVEEGLLGAFEFSPTGATLASWANEGFAASLGLAVDSADHLYIPRGNPLVQKFDAAGNSLGTVDSTGKATGLTADDTDGLLFVDEGSFVNVFELGCDQGCDPVTSFGAGVLGAATAIGVEAGAGRAYVADTSRDTVEIFGPPPPIAPSVSSESSVADVTTSSALLKGTLNPNYFATTYHFEYGTADCATGACSSSPVPDAKAGEAGSSEAVSTPLTGLQPGTTYHYRLLATNLNGTTPGPDHIFTTAALHGPEACPNAAIRRQQGSTQLPDCRAYEQVSPTDKNHGDVRNALSYALDQQSSADANAFTYVSSDAFAGPASAGIVNQYLARRTANGWIDRNISPPQTPKAGVVVNGAYRGFSADLGNAFLIAGNGPLAPGAPENYPDPYLRDNLSGAYTPLLSIAPPNRPPGDSGGTEAFFVNFAGASADWSSVLFDANDALLPGLPDPEGALPAGRDLYDWSAGQLHLVNVLPDGEPSSSGLFATPNKATAYSSLQGSPYLGRDISSDGSRVFWTGPEGNLYLRRNPAAPQSPIDGAGACEVAADACTVQLDAPAPGAPGPGGGATFQTASADGRYVFFTDDAVAGLTADTRVGSGVNLYRYDLQAPAGEHLLDLTVAPEVGVEGVFGASEDGSYLYFRASGKLSDGASAGPGAHNVYLSHEGVLSWIANDAPSASFSFASPAGGANYAISADGHALSWRSPNRLTGYDNREAQEDYLYEAPSTRLVCASCNPTGAPPIAGENGHMGEVVLPLFPSNPFNQNNLSANGRRLFFDTTDSLLPRDQNGREDVYEYADGAVHLISAGSSADNSTFVGASPSGDDAFFITRDRLVSGDLDENLDLYDARVDGGFAAPAGTSPPCAAEACRSPFSPPPALQPPGTSAFAGPGNTRPRRKRHHSSRHKSQRSHRRPHPARHPSGSQRRIKAHRKAPVRS